LLLTFLLSGFFLHDLPFTYHLGFDLLRGTTDFPSVTLLFGLFGLLTLLSERVGRDLSCRSPFVRAGANLIWLSIAFGGRKVVMTGLGF
jgi:hypothetical protein